MRSRPFVIANHMAFVFDDESKRRHFRSASRTGYGDLGVNHSRMEPVRCLVGETW
jgi:uncharacterized protein (DUF1499 family)